MFFDILFSVNAVLNVYFHGQSTRIREDFRLQRKKITMIKTSLLPLALKMFKLAEVLNQILNLLYYTG